MSRRLAAGTVAVAAGLALAGCGKGHTTAAPTTTAAASISVVAAPSDCRTPDSQGVHDATNAVQILLGVDYRNILVVLSVARPLLTTAYFTTFSTYVSDSMTSFAQEKLTEKIVTHGATLSSGDCTTPVYAIPVTRTSGTSAKPAQTQDLTVHATMTWNGTAYLLSALSTQ